MTSELQFVYVVHGFGAAHVFASLKGARKWRKRFAAKCEIAKCVIHPDGAVDAAIALADKVGA